MPARLKLLPGLYSNMDVLPHPHIGLSTVSYLFGGQVTHRDSLGVEQMIKPGEVNWMTAGSGIAHSERFEDPAALAGGELEMIQTWVAFPKKQKSHHHPSIITIPLSYLYLRRKGLWMRLIAGDAYGLTNKVKTHSPLYSICMYCSMRVHDLGYLKSILKEQFMLQREAWN